MPEKVLAAPNPALVHLNFKKAQRAGVLGCLSPHTAC